jgi:hypothetical protein
MTSEDDDKGRDGGEAESESGSGAGAGGEASGEGGGPQFAERVYRSPAGMGGGIVLLAIGLWLSTDAVIGGEGRTPWLTLAGLLLAVPLVVAFTLRPAVFAGERQLRVRNPFRTIEVPWGAVEEVRAGYSSEVVADGAKYQLWSIPVSLRARKKATRHNERVASGRSPGSQLGSGAGVGGLFGGRGIPDIDPGPAATAEKRAPSDQAVDELRELHETHGDKEECQGQVAVRWAFEVVAPAVAGAVVLAVLLATR